MRDGEIPGPTLFTAGPILDGPNSEAPHLKISNAEQAIATIRQQHAAGYDFIKIYDGLPRNAYLAGMKEAHALGMQFVGHIPTSMGADGAIAAHQDSLEHLEELVYHHFDRSMDETELPSFAQKVKRSGCYVCPTVGLIHNYIELVDSRQTLLSRPEVRYANPEVRAWWSTLTRDSAGQNRLIAYFQAKLLKAFADAGVQLISGTDTHLVGFVPGFALHREFAWMIDAGLGPYQVIESSTANAGRFLHRKVGLVAPGYQADLLLVRRNPLESVEALKMREGVMIRGKWHAQGELDRLMEDLVASYGGK